MKKLNDLSPYVNVLPYASEIFGVYQPLIGWRSARTYRRFERGFRTDVDRALTSLHRRFQGEVEVAQRDPRSPVEVKRLEPGTLRGPQERPLGSFVLDSIRASLPAAKNYDDAVWDDVLEPARVAKTLTDEVVPRLTEWHAAASQPAPGERSSPAAVTRAVVEQLNLESATAGYLMYLKQTGQVGRLRDVFYRHDGHLERLQALLEIRDPLELIDPTTEIDRVTLSPIGIVHLFRQYFFELDTFLGPSVSHVWLSPGSTVELVEVSTRKTLVERITESSTESIVKTEKETTEEDELSDAVKQENRSETKFGMNASVTQGWIGGSATASGSIDLASTQSKARETTHRHMRQQTEKVSTEIRKNFKSTFRTVTETTDMSSKRYVLRNKTQELINYELRRKMRQVGVQVQDIGTYLCWQTYVDDPGRELGIAKLVHLAKDPELGHIPPPEEVPMPPTVVTEHPVSIPFVPKTEDTEPEDMDEAYKNGWEVNTDTAEGDSERIATHFTGLYAECDQPGYEWAEKIEFDYGGADVQISLYGEVAQDPPGRVTYGIHLDYVNFHNVSPLKVTAKVTWKPSQATVAEIEAKNLEKVEAFNQETKRAFEKAFIEAARDRIKKASNIEPRKFEDLREEERIVVYRRLVQDMLTQSIPMPDDRTRHAVAELLNTIFDIDKMLYFVAPEWWRPRLHRSHQALGGRQPAPGTKASTPRATGRSSVYQRLQAKAAAKAVIAADVHAIEDDADESELASVETVSWGGADESRKDNYYITEESQPAKLGSSLGWLLQLDGDNMRNAFLNAPWVKAVIPVRPGRERAAINWLQHVNVEGSDGLDAEYVALPSQLAQIPHSGAHVTIRDAINHLCDVVADKHERSTEVGQYPTDEIHDDNRVAATPIDRVYEHGFYPLTGGFRVMPADKEDFEVFDQWVEVLPTDQIVPVEVAYDPKTGRML